MNSGKQVVINTPANFRKMAKVIFESHVLPEIKLFDSGDIALMKDMLTDGSLQGPLLCSFVMGVPYGFQPSAETVLYARNLLPSQAQFMSSASAGGFFRRSRSRTSPEATYASAWRTASIWRAASLHRQMLDGREGAPNRRGSRRRDCNSSRSPENCRPGCPCVTPGYKPVAMHG